MLEDYEEELDPPTMSEFMLFYRLANMLDMYDNPGNWTDLEMEEEVLEVSDLVEQLAGKYDKLLGDYYRGQKESQ